jgi:hypothetical protein
VTVIESLIAEIREECRPQVDWPGDGGAVAANVLSIVEDYEDGDLSIWEQVAVEARPVPGWEDRQ